jgi:RNA polymerase sigma factor (sigma-70 family)
VAVSTPAGGWHHTAMCARPVAGDRGGHGPGRQGGFGVEDSGAIEREAGGQRALDRALAEELGEKLPNTAPVTVGYLRELDQRPILGEGAVAELVAAAKAGDRAARARLIEAFLPRIASLARTYRHRTPIERVDLLQEGVVGLLRALERYDPSLGVPFWGYAVWWVRQAMQQLVSELALPVILSDRALRQLARIKDVHRSYVQEHGHEPSAAQLADGAEVSPEHAAKLIAVDQPVRRLDEPVTAEDGNLGTFGELLVDPIAEDEYERVIGRMEVAELRSLLSGLDDRERMVVRARYGLGGEEQTLREIGSRLGLSAERVRQIEQRALGKLRAAAAV